MNFRAEENHDVFFGFERGFQLHERFGGGRVECAFAMREPAHCSALAALGGFHQMRGLAMDLAFDAVDDVEARLVMAHAGANLPGDQRILLRDVVADQQDGGRGVDIRHRGESAFGVRAQRGGEAGVIRGAVVIDIVGAERGAREAIQQIIFFVRGVVRADHADGVRAVLVAHLLQAARDFFERIFPACRLELAVAANQRLAHALGVIGEIETEAALAAEEFAVDAGVSRDYWRAGFRCCAR